MSETAELAKKLAHRNAVNDGQSQPQMANITSPYVEFPEFSRKQIKEFERIFKQFDVNQDNHLDQVELQVMMEKLGNPQTFIGLKTMIREVDEDKDEKVSFREFLLIFRRAASCQLEPDSPWLSLASLPEVDITDVGVGGAKNFFEAKVKKISETNKFEAEIKAEQEEKRRALEEQKKRKEEFQAKRSNFA